MTGRILLFVSSALLVLWGIAHLVFTRPVVKDFGDISSDNRLIITMEWIMEGVCLVFIGSIVLSATIAGYHDHVTKIVHLVSSVMLIIMALVSFFTGFRIKFPPFRLCPFILLSSAALILIATYTR